MAQLKLIIGNKNYSSWSLRPWLLLKQFDIPFEEIKIPLYRADSAQALARYSPSGLVPVLWDGELAVWESLAICEYLQTLYPHYALWPQSPQACAVARAVSAEMHAGFTAVREAMPMNCRKQFPGAGLTTQSRADIARITQLWHDCRQRYGQAGPMLFGDFSIADAMYAPIVLRFKTYDVALDPVCAAYSAAILALPALQAWIAAAKQEPETLEQFEPYNA